MLPVSMYIVNIYVIFISVCIQDNCVGYMILFVSNAIPGEAFVYVCVGCILLPILYRYTLSYTHTLAHKHTHAHSCPTPASVAYSTGLCAS